MASTLLEWKLRTLLVHLHVNVLSFRLVNFTLFLSLVCHLEKVCVLTCDGRFLVGQLMGHDQVQNLILNEAMELLYSKEESVEQVPLGLYVIRGDNVAVVGELDKVDFSIKAEPLAVIHQQIL
jgi:U6 snRNA-associated Sm-like protein LSm8